jgi:hypothetical protein
LQNCPKKKEMTMVEMQYVQSSNVECVGYDPEFMELHVRFINSAITYVYINVPQLVFDEMMSAPSKGSYLNRCVKNVYHFVTR